jgi:hypothetical protein
MRPLPLSNSRSFSSVSKALRMAELALKTSSRKAIPAVGRKPVHQPLVAVVFQRLQRQRAEQLFGR